MGDQHTLFSPVQEGGVWRVQIIWPNGAPHRFGKFTSEKEASEWIKRHEWWLTEPITENLTSEPNEPSSAA